MIILIPEHIFDFSETGTGTAGEIADRNCAEGFAVVIGDRTITLSLSQQLSALASVPHLRA